MWSVVILVSYFWNSHQVQSLLLDQARTELRANFFKDQTFRLWATKHGGVYVPVTETQKPDPYVEFLPERDIVTSSGKTLTLINPALMVRQFNELAKSKFGAEGHISGIKPLNPINTADEWEFKSFDMFKRGAKEFTEVTSMNNEPYLRLIRPMHMAAPCLKCHAQQGFTVGDLAGGVSVSVPLTPIERLREMRMITLGAGHTFIWVLGLTGIGIARRQIITRVEEREQIFDSLQENEARTRAIVSSSLDAIITADANGIITGWNEQASTIFGWSEQDTLGEVLSNLIVPERLREAHNHGLQRAAASSQVHELNRRVEVVGLNRDGQEFPVELSITTFYIDGEIAFTAFIRDISDRKAAEEKIERDYASQQLIASVLETSLQPAPFEQRLEQILHQLLATSWLNLQGKGAVYLVNDSGDTLEMATQSGMPAKTVEKCATVPLGVCLCGQAAATGEVIYKACVDDDHHRIDSGSEQHGHYCLPIKSSDRLLGILTLYLDHDHQRSEEEIQLLSTISHTIGGMIQRNEAEQSLLHNAYHDDLTGLPNRLLFMDRLAQAMARHERNQDYKFAVLFLDLDRFKVINDSLGHSFGDKLLVKVAKRLESCSRPTDTVARLGGDEFTMLIEGPESELDISRVTSRIHSELRNPIDLIGHEIFAPCSIGIAFGNSDYKEPEEILRDADTAMYRAKSESSIQTVFFDEAMHTSALSRLTMETDLRRAFENQELSVHYQPIVAAATGEIEGFEALARWQRSDGSMVSPVEFIPVAEETGLINELGMWVLHQACKHTKQWREAHPKFKDLYISVNLSGKQLLQADLFNCIETILLGVGFDPSCLRLEITESTLMADTTANNNLLTKFRDRGYRFYIDDFGTGYSSLSYLHSFPFEALKIDRSFVLNLDQGSEHIDMVETIVAIAHNFGMEVIAEGVETEAHLKQLRDLGCERLQGYLFSRPLPPEAVSELLANPEKIAIKQTD
ncbi:EAL domain-containing protein [Candidatus Reidiella endopervernicosa]|uniref:EAL domain-containing protein n=1 Tax=Candidatus Reidiella endopervernicosa TaxID=2738883 RepID=A0A6N0HY51_9GAMM|nr:EAL domain-containing protein [Candidatus Reidiella endopervernicosa]QKQ27227.1 EAL domain-containing protein [Candidatus Reidiella endopervernicosa]